MARLLVLVLLIACGDAASRNRVRADARRAADPARWSDEELVMFVRAAARTFIGDAAVVARASRSRAVMAHAARAAEEYRALLQRADSVSGATEMPLPASRLRDVLAAHASERDSIARRRNFDVRYLGLVQGTFHAANAAFARALDPPRPESVRALVRAFQTVSARQRQTVRIMDAALQGEARRGSDASSPRDTPRGRNR